MRPPLRFTIEDAERAWDQWKFNCGPAALCAVLDKTPDEIRPHLGDFETKAYTNPTLMYEALARLGAKWIPHERARSERPSPQGVSVPPRPIIAWPKLGLVRIQWEGPWTSPGVPFRVRYRQTHWIGVHLIDPAFQWERQQNGSTPVEIFDVNCLSVGGWVSLDEWAGQVVPWLLGALYPEANGKWHQTHVLELTRPSMC